MPIELSPLPAFNPLDQPEQAINFINNYLLPRPLGGCGHRAHQFTINGLTYPFIRYYNFAAVPDVPRDRRYDMYAGVHLAQPGDLLFFFEADPHLKNKGIDSRRGIRGVYRVIDLPYRASQDASDDREGGTNYLLLSRCPNCGCVHATLKAKCSSCDMDFPLVEIHGEPHHALLLSTRLPIEPFFLFERSVSDERAYADFRDPGLIWVGRHDNAMGAGKGSSIRQLLPEEAVKLVRLLLTEPEQSIGMPHNNSDPVGAPLAHQDGNSIDFLPLAENGDLFREDELYFLLAKQALEPNSEFRSALFQDMPEGMSWEHLEYVSSTFPWGYTAGAADFILIFRMPPPAGRCFIVIVECKRGRAHDEAIRQVLLYAERVVQVAFLSAPSEAYSDTEITVLPIVIAAGAKRPRNMDRRVAIPETYHESARYMERNEVRYQVLPTKFLTYATHYVTGERLKHYSDINLLQLAEDRRGRMSWVPPFGAVGTAPELDWIRDNSWQEARTAANFSPR